jgi:hypothetical protein
MLKSLLKARWVDDGMYCVGWWIEEEDGERFAEAGTEEAANEIVTSVNLMRKLGQRIFDIAQSEGLGDQ